MSAFATLTLHYNFHTRKMTLPFNIADPTAKQYSTFIYINIFLQFLFVLFFSSIFLILHRPLREIRVALPGQGTAAERAALPIPISATHSCPVCPNTACSQSAQSTTTTITITTNQPTRKGMQLDKSVQLYVISQRQLCSVSEFARAKGPGDNLPIKSAFEHLTNCFQITARGGAGPAWPISPVWTRTSRRGRTVLISGGAGPLEEKFFCRCAVCPRHATRLLDVKLWLLAHGGESYYIVCTLQFRNVSS